MTTAIILCGGQSSRMGFPKALLPFGPETMLERVLGLLESAVDHRVVVAAAGQSLPPLPAEITVCEDQHPERGPMEGLAAGLRASPDDICYVTSCDAPFLKPAWITALLERLGEDDEIVVPTEGRLHHPLAAVYRRCVLPQIDLLLSENRLRPFFLFENVPTQRVDVETLRAADPELESLMNVNTPQEYLSALERAGFDCEPEMRQRLTENLG